MTERLNIKKYLFKNQLATVNSRLIEFREKQKWAQYTDVKSKKHLCCSFLNRYFKRFPDKAIVCFGTTCDFWRIHESLISKSFFFLFASFNKSKYRRLQKNLRVEILLTALQTVQLIIACHKVYIEKKLSFQYSFQKVKSG